MSRSLLGHTLRGVRWGALSTATNVVVQIGTMAVMARLLAPQAFGLVALAQVVLRFFGYFAQVGIGPALIQRATLVEADKRLALGLLLAIGASFALGMALLAPVFAALFHAPALVDVLRVLGLNFLIISLGALPQALLQRALRFRATAALESLSFVGGALCVGLPLAWAGAGVWALVGSTLGQSSLLLVGGWLLARPPLRPQWQGDRAALLGYGMRHSLVTFLEYLGDSLDSLLIGRLLGTAPLGLYNRALMLASLPVEYGVRVLSRVLFPVLSRNQDDAGKVGHVFLLGTTLVGMFAGAVSFGLAAAAPDVVPLVLGPQWGDTVPVVQILALAMPMAYMTYVSGVVCDACGLLAFKLRLQAATVLLLGLLMFLLAPQGLTGFALAVLIAKVVRQMVYLLVLRPRLMLPRADLATVLAVIVVFAAGSAACVRAAGMFGGSIGAPLALRVALEVSAGIAWAVAGTLAATPVLSKLAAFRRLRAQLPQLESFWRRFQRGGRVTEGA